MSNSVSIGSIHKMQGRIVICVNIWWKSNKVDYYTFYEPGTDKRNDVTNLELEKMLDEKTLIEYTPEFNRKL